MKCKPLAILCVAIVVCPLVPLHFRPQTDFYTEWVFAMLTSFAWLTVKQPLTMPIVRQNPLLLILAVVGAAAVLSVFWERGQGPAPIMTVLYCLFGAGLYVLVRGLLGQQEEAEKIGQKVAAAVLLSGLLACLPAAFQLFGLTPGVLLVVERGASEAVFGNLAQANLLADWLWLAICAAAYLGGTKQIGTAVTSGAIAVLTAFATFTASRSIWLYPVAAVVFLFVTRQRSGGHAFRQPIMKLVGLGLLVQAGWHVLLTWSGIYAFFGIRSSAERLQRMTGDEGGGGLRLALWSRGLRIIENSPWWGEGPGSYSWSALQVMTTPGGNGPAPVGEHAHNVFLELAVEFGIPLAICVLLLLVWWGAQWWAKGLRPTTQWALASLAVVGVHSFLEYPLWSVEFLGMAVIFFALVDHEVRVDLKGCRLPVAAFQVFGMLALGSLGLLYAQYRPSEWAHNEFEIQMSLGAELPFMTSEMVERLETVPDWSPMRSYAEAVAAATASPDMREAARWGPLCERVIRFRPSPLIFGRCAVIFELSGNEERANYLAELGCTAFPSGRNHFPEGLRSLTQSMGAERVPAGPCLQAHESK